MADDMAWDQWVTRHGAAAMLFARQFTHSPADAEDAVQDGFIRFWGQRDRARDPVAFLFTCVRSAALDLRRGQKRRVVREHKVAEDRPPLATADPDAAWRREAVERALAELSEPQRAVVVLKTWAGLTLAQIATTLNESPNTIATRYRYALEKLGQILTPEVRHER